MMFERYSFVNTFDKQNEILTYLHPYNIYRSLIICYGVGTGKTYAAACLSQLYLNEGYKVLYVSNSINSINNFQEEYNKMIQDNSFKNLSKFIEIKTYSKLYKIGIEDKYGLIILDEIHNLRENAKRYKPIKDSIHKLINCKILVITATPMIDSTNELNSIYNITEEKVIIFSDEKKNEAKVVLKGEKIGNQILYLSEMKGIQKERYLNEKHIDKKSIYSRSRQTSVCVNDIYDPYIPLDEQSAKIDKVIKNLKPNCLTVIFSFYIKRGINFIAQVLDNMGYSKWDSETIDDGLKYAIIDGNKTLNETKLIMNQFNSIANIDGKKIHILIGSSVLSESITLYRVNEVHILTPHWNYGQIEQSIGRTIRYGSHKGLKNKIINIYLHASHINGDGIDLEMWSLAYLKEYNIKNKLKEEKNNEHCIKVKQIEYPEPDDNLIFKINNVIWDFRECFDYNKYKISWCNFKAENIVAYDLDQNKKVVGSRLPSEIRVNIPTEKGYTIWRSCIDQKLRITFIDDKKGKYKHRGKILSNVIYNELKSISILLNCRNTIHSISAELKKKGRFYNKQIEYVSL